jgi:guanylate kinase
MERNSGASFKPKLFVISAPSGSGKTTIVHELLKRHPEMLFSVSATTRAKREFETDGSDYFFLSKIQFEEYIHLGRLVEWEQIYGNYYGTLRSEIDKALRQGKSMLFDIDVKGALSIKQHYPKDSMLIFIKPPSMEVLTERLKKRKTENSDSMLRRLERVPMELEQAKEFDVSVVNDDLNKAVSAIDEIISHALSAPV